MSLENLRRRARALKEEVAALAVAARDPRTPAVARLVVFLTVAYALSPVDLIPDFVPVLGLLDDLIVVPFGIALAIRIIPAEAMADARATARSVPPLFFGRIGIVLVVLAWLAALAGAWMLLRLR